MDMSVFDAFQLRVRGDGRKYMVNVQSPGLARKDDIWQCFLFTRGGPEWENIMASCFSLHFNIILCVTISIYTF